MESPDSLQNLCLDHISKNISNSSDRYLYFCNENFYLHSQLSEALLTLMSNHGTLTDNTLTIFDSRYADLRRVKIKHSNYTNQGLRIFKTHRISELEAVGLKDVPVNELIWCLSEWTLSNLRLLNVSGCNFGSSAKFPVVVVLSKLHSLQSLNVSNTEFNTHCLEIVANDLPLLTSLDISETRVDDITPLQRYKDRLQTLRMYNVRVNSCSVFSTLRQLRYLDVSDDYSAFTFLSLNFDTYSYVADMLAKPELLPELVAFDISGNFGKEGIDLDQLRNFVVAHPKLEFLGLALIQNLDLTEKLPDFLKHITITGSLTEEQIVESLKRYVTRPFYVKQSLLQLFQLTRDLTQPRPDFLKITFPIVRYHVREFNIHLAATACFYNILKNDLVKLIHPKWLTETVNTTMFVMENAMENSTIQQALVKNCLLILCNDIILQDVSFDKFKCAKLAMQSLCGFKDHAMNRMSLAICTILAARMPTDQTSEIGSDSRNMTRMLTIVKEKTESLQSDAILKFTLSTLWNLSDEAPATCDAFLKLGGLDVFLGLYRAFQSTPDDVRVQIEVKILGFLNNVAEVGHLRQALMREDILSTICNLLHSKHLDVSYYSAGILSHLISGNCWGADSSSRQQLLADLGEVIQNWKQPENEMVAYRSFVPFFPLLRQSEEAEVQMWALWAWQHVCTMDVKRYVSILVNQDCLHILDRLITNPRTDPRVVDLAKSILNIATNNNDAHSRPIPDIRFGLESKSYQCYHCSNHQQS